ncbi:polygalacturonase inhibitor-like [Musa acuminata AAA Group]|uniref:polygalacturonase inhibitor-like n=1 Tax=Musa acuminata AAA Group TaxID=214697 RepID=UPI0031D8C2C4
MPTHYGFYVLPRSHQENQYIVSYLHFFPLFREEETRLEMIIMMFGITACLYCPQTFLPYKTDVTYFILSSHANYLPDLIRSIQSREVLFYDLAITMSSTGRRLRFKGKVEGFERAFDSFPVIRIFSLYKGNAAHISSIHLHAISLREMSPSTTILCGALLFFLLVSSTLPAASFDCDAGDRAALLKIKKGLGNPRQLNSWIPATNCCNWYHVGCDSQSGRVVSLLLRDTYGVVADKVPAAIGDLPLLQVLALKNMPGLSGPIPRSFAKLRYLAGIFIKNNSINGTIPRFFSNLPELRVIDLSDNKFTGPIPPGLSHGETPFLVLRNNLLTGEIPASYGDVEYTTFDVSHNRLTGSASFLFKNRSRSTFDISLSWNQLEFDITEAALPVKLRTLDVSHNRIRGGVPKALEDNYYMYRLNLSYNQLCGEIPTAGAMEAFGADSFLHNKCLCGPPLPPCRH